MDRMLVGARRGFDFVLLLLVVLIMAFGVAAVCSATGFSLDPSGVDWDAAAVRQVLYGVGGLALLVLVSAIDYHVWLRLNWVLYGLMLSLLLLLFVVGQVSFGAKSWLDLVLFPMQPSELGKVLLILVLARYISRRSQNGAGFRHLVSTCVIVGLPAILVYMQPDMGTALVMVAIWLGMVYAGGIRIRDLLVIAAAGGLALPAIWSSLRPYMRDRITSFVNPSPDLTGASYNTRQAVISIGSGGLWGKGFGLGTQSQLQFLRVRHTDFAFSVLAEETGFVGSLLLLVLITLLLMRIIGVAQRARDLYGRLIACGVATMIFFQSFVSLAMNVNIIPVTGLPLPLVSYGGSSLLNTLIALGLVESVAARQREPAFETY